MPAKLTEAQSAMLQGACKIIALLLVEVNRKTETMPHFDVDMPVVGQDFMIKIDAKIVKKS